MATRTHRERWIVICLALAGFIATIDDYIVAVSLPSIAADFDATTSEVSLVTVVYLLTLVSTLLLFGRIGDRVGHRRVFLWGYVVFVVGSAACALSPTLGILIGSRVFQGAGAAMLSVTGPALIASHVDEARRGWAFGIFTTVTALGITLGAPLGGIITGLVGWNAIFAVNVPIGIVAAIVSRRVIPSDPPTATSDRGFDPLGVLLSGTGLALLVLALNRGEESGGFSSPIIVGMLAGSVATLAAFVWWEQRQPDPLLDFSVLRNRSFVGGLIAALAGYMLLAGCNFVFPFYLTYVKGLNPAEVGLVMLAYSVVYVAASPFMGRLADRASSRLVSATGMLSAAAASVALVLVAGLPGLLLPLVYLVWRAVSYAMFIAPNNALVMSGGADADRGRSSAMLKVSVNLSLVLGLVVFETLFSLPLAEGLGSLSTTTAAGHTTTEHLLTGVQLAYAFGFIVCLAAAGVTLVLTARPPSNEPATQAAPATAAASDT